MSNQNFMGTATGESVDSGGWGQPRPGSQEEKKKRKKQRTGGKKAGEERGKRGGKGRGGAAFGVRTNKISAKRRKIS